MLNFGNSEILQIADSVAREKGLPRDIVINAMEQAIQIAGRKKYGHEHNIKAEISRNTGEIKLFRVMNIVEKPEDTISEISLKDALEKNPQAELGGEILDPLPPIDLGRVAAQTAKQVIMQKVREAEREKQFEDFKDRVGEILNGVVKRIDLGNVIVDLGRTEAVIKKNQLIRGESFKINDRVRAYVQDVVRSNTNPQIILSRTDDHFLVKLMELEVPEIYDGVIQIKRVARDPGSKAKVAVYTSDSSIDPVGSCVGVKGSRIRSVTNELNGEKIDVILWSNDPAQFVINALAPAQVSKVVIHEEQHKVDVVMAEDQLSLAIGKRGQNIRLASRITGWSLDVLSEDQESKRRVEEFNSTTELFVAALDVEEMLAQLLTAEGFSSIEQIAYVDSETLANIEGLDLETANALKDRAASYINSRNEKFLSELEALGVEQELLDVLEIDLEHLVTLARAGIKTLEDLGEIQASEFMSLVPNSGLTVDQVKSLIKAIREQDSKDGETEATGS